MSITIHSALSLQSLYDQAAKHLLRQGRPSKDGEDCLYHGPSGLRCPVGMWITDERYHQSIEGRTLREVMSYLPSHFVHFEDLLLDLQRIHDQCPVTDRGEFVYHNLVRRLHDLADTYRLKKDCAA